MGADEFSIPSLQALHQEHKKNPSLISSLHVLCKSDSLTGRRRDVVKEVPLKAVAQALNLRLQTIQSFTSYTLPDPSINLLVAVSFGLLVPAELIFTAKYGGLNVHPSLLPMYRGAAPIHRTILNNTPITGVTIQTLDPYRFDHGKLLMQTEPPMPVDPSTGFHSLRDTLAEKGAMMLLEAIRQGIFLPPLREVDPRYPASLARKITNKDMRIDWNSWTSRDIQRRARMFGSVWAELGNDTSEKPEFLKRANLSDIKILNTVPDVQLRPGCFRYYRDCNSVVVMALRCLDGWVGIGNVQVDGKKSIQGGIWITGLQSRGEGKKFW